MLDTRGNIREEYIQNRNDNIIATVGTNRPTSSDQIITDNQQLATALVAVVHIPSGTISAVKMLILTATPLTVIRRLPMPSSNLSHWHTR